MERSGYGNCLSTNVRIPDHGAGDLKLPGELQSPQSQCLLARGSSAQAYLSRKQPFDVSKINKTRST